MIYKAEAYIHICTMQGTRGFNHAITETFPRRDVVRPWHQKRANYSVSIDVLCLGVKGAGLADSGDHSTVGPAPTSITLALDGRARRIVFHLTEPQGAVWKPVDVSPYRATFKEATRDGPSRM